MSINPRVSIKTIVRDDEDRLSLSGAMAIAPYSYDKAGNNQNNSAVYNLLNNQLQQSALYTITYDVMGNIKTKYNKLNKTTSKYTFNARNQLTQYTQEDENNQTTKTLSYTYDAFGRRVSKTEDTVTQKYLYDGDAPQGHFLTSSGHIIAILDNDNQVIATITHDESIDTPLSITNNNGTFYYHRDHQGSIIALTDSTGAVVESFTYDNHYGTITNHTKTTETDNPYAYTGRELDTDELYYYRARYYDPALQRFLGEDPIGFSSGDTNFYRYVGNDPLNLKDPTGKFAWGLLFAGADLLYQLYENGGNFKCVNWSEVGLSLLGGGLLNGLTKGAFVWRGSQWSSTWGARSAWMRRNGIMPRSSGQQWHHWAVPQKYYRGNSTLEHIFNQPWNINPINGAFNNWLGAGFWKTKLGAPLWAGEALGGGLLGAGGSNGENCECN